MSDSIVQHIYFSNVVSIRSDLPQVAALRVSVENKVGHPIETHTHFIQLVEMIDDATNEHMSESTLERMWNYTTRSCSFVSLRTLNVLSAFSGYQDWKEFCEISARELPIESEIFSGKILDVDSLKIGSQVRIGWQPDRLCIIRYLGGHRFMAEETHNSSIQPGDTFSCIQMQLGRELYLDKFVRANGEESRYVVGQRNGLTTLEIIL